MAVAPRQQLDVLRHLLVIVIIGLFVVGSLYVLRPFLAALIWATMITVATWPLLLKMQHRLGGRRGLAVLVMIVVMLLVIVLPLAAAGHHRGPHRCDPRLGGEDAVLCP